MLSSQSCGKSRCLYPCPRTTRNLRFNVVTLGELLFGALKSQRKDEELKSVHSFIASVTVHDCKPATSLQYGELRHFLSSIGNPLPDNDVWIAASALEHNLTLVTRDAHFDAIPHLTKERW